MAVVKMSKRLREEILKKAKEIFEVQETRLQEEVLVALTHELAADLAFKHNRFHYNRQIQDELRTIFVNHSLTSSNNPFARPVKEFNLRFEFREVGEDGKKEESFSVDFSKPAPPGKYFWPLHHMNWDKTTTDRIAVPMDWQGLTCISHTDPIYQHLVGKCKDLLAKKRERKQFITLVSNTLHAANSLRQFLKAWPEGQALVPDEDLNELNRPTGRNKTKTDDSIDEETRKQLSGTLLINKIQSSN